MLELWQAHLTFSLFAFVVLPGFGLGPSLQAVRLIVLLGISFIPVDGLSLAAYMRSFTDDVAITSLVALAFATAVRMGMAARLGHAARLQLLIVMAALALFLYPATMGLTYVDPYRWGFNPRPMIVLVAVAALGMLALRNTLVVWMLAVGTLAFALRLKASENYWDYLIDPLLATYCVIAGLMQFKLWERACSRMRGVSHISSN